jgi:hypothetical protein
MEQIHCQVAAARRFNALGGTRRSFGYGIHLRP